MWDPSPPPALVAAVSGEEDRPAGFDLTRLAEVGDLARLGRVVKRGSIVVMVGSVGSRTRPNWCSHHPKPCVPQGEPRQISAGAAGACLHHQCVLCGRSREPFSLDDNPSTSELTRCRSAFYRSKTQTDMFVRLAPLPGTDRKIPIRGFDRSGGVRPVWVIDPVRFRRPTGRIFHPTNGRSDPEQVPDTWSGPMIGMVRKAERLCENVAGLTEHDMIPAL